MFFIITNFAFKCKSMLFEEITPEINYVGSFSSLVT